MMSQSNIIRNNVNLLKDSEKADGGFISDLIYNVTRNASVL